MARPRKELVSVSDTPYYHIVSRCVRRSFLCGYDHTNQKDYEYRRQWIVDRLRLLSSLFAIDICAYAVMSNHYHLCLKLDPEQADLWSNTDVADRWCSLFKGPLLIQKWRSGDSLTPAELNAVSEILTVYRQRLSSLSWFMKCLNEPIARQANQEDKCTGHFWESRFKSQALLSEEALLSCMVYIDLNPIRAAMAKTPEESDHTSIQERIQPRFNLADAIKRQVNLEAINGFEFPLKPLAHFTGAATQAENQGIELHLADYLELVDQTGRIVREDKRGAIDDSLPSILLRLNINPNSWLENAMSFEGVYAKKFRRRCINKTFA